MSCLFFTQLEFGAKPTISGAFIYIAYVHVRFLIPNCIFELLDSYTGFNTSCFYRRINNSCTLRDLITSQNSTKVSDLLPFMSTIVVNTIKYAIGILLGMFIGYWFFLHFVSTLLLNFSSNNNKKPISSL